MQKIYNRFSKARGFTLIELLVVIAIIGILAGIVLASLSTARGGANDAKVKEQLNSARTQAEIVYGTSGNQYGTAAPADNTCPATANSLTGDSTIQSLLTSLPSGTEIRCGVSVARDAYAITASLGSTGNADDRWCVDSTGASRQINAPVANLLVTDSSCTLMDN